jgi:elongation factor Ts
MVELNCETDFVAKNDEFRAFANDIAAVVLHEGAADVDTLASRKLASGETVDARRVALVQKIGENVSLRRVVRLAAQGRIASYVHGTKIGVLVDYSGGDDALGKDLAMHVAAKNPIAV